MAETAGGRTTGHRAQQARLHPAEEFAAAKDDLVDLTRRGDRGVDRKVCRHVRQQAGGLGVEVMGDGHGRVSDPG